MSLQFPMYPGLQALRQAEIEDAYKQLTGPLSPEFQNEFMRNATLQARTTTGGGDPFSGMGLKPGTMNRGAMSANVARQTMAKQDYDRLRLQNLIQQNPMPGLGLTQDQIMAMYVYNTGAQNASAMQNYANSIAGANAAYQNQVQTWQGVGNLVSGLGSIYSNYQNYGGGYGGAPYAGDWSGMFGGGSDLYAMGSTSG
jgi:hypothetical protein